MTSDVSSMYRRLPFATAAPACGAVDAARARGGALGVEQRSAAQLQLLGGGDSLQDEPVPLRL